MVIKNRTYSGFCNNYTKALLEKLLTNLNYQDYRTTISEIGSELGKVLVNNIKPSDNVYLACTVEDADFLARSILNELELSNQDKVHFACFWNRREKLGSLKLAISPIIKRYVEPCPEPDVLIIAKSIISGSCVIKTNLVDLIQEFNPKRIIVAAPVMLKGSQEDLKKEFNDSISSMFEFIPFAIDAGRNEKREVDPGIGGDIYKLLGYSGQEEKNRVIPELVRERRKLIGVGA